MTKLNRKKAIVAFALLLGTAVSGCTVDRQVRGYVIDTDLTEGVVVGLDNMSSVARLLGNPSMKGTFSPDVWYYINEKAIRRSFFKPHATERTIMALYFDDVGVLDEIKTYTLADARKIRPRKDKTPTRGKKLGFFEQIFGNIGRFSGTPGSSSNPGG